MIRMLACLGAILAISLGAGCVSTAQVNFPPSRDVFVTTGDGDITKPYEPVGQLLYVKQGFRMNWVPILGLIPFGDVDPDVAMQEGVAAKVKEMGGDGVINLRIAWEPSSNGFLGWGATGGSVAVSGTVIKR